MSAHPRIDALLAQCDQTPKWRYLGNDPEAIMGLLATELRALLAENAALKAPKAARKLRKYKGVTYRDGKWWIKSFSYTSAASFIHNNRPEFDDADHAAIYALKDDPYEPVETVEDILRALCVDVAQRAEWATRLRAAVLAEPTRGEG